MPEQLVVTYAKAGEILMGISERTVRRMVKNGDLPRIKVRGRVGIPYDALVVYLNSKTEYAKNEEAGQCLTAETIAHTGGSRTPITQANRLAEVVKLQTTRKQKP